MAATPQPPHRDDTAPPRPERALRPIVVALVLVIAGAVAALSLGEGATWTGVGLALIGIASGLAVAALFSVIGLGEDGARAGEQSTPGRRGGGAGRSAGGGARLLVGPGGVARLDRAAREDGARGARGIEPAGDNLV